MGWLFKTSLHLLLLIVCASQELMDLEWNDMENSSQELCYICSCSAEFTAVDCSRRGLTDIPDVASEKVHFLNVSHNELTNFPANLARFPNLLELDLSGNQLKSIPQNALHNLTKLKILELSRNDFDTWGNLNPNDILTPAKRLKVLDLSHNKFTSLGNLNNEEKFVSSSLEKLYLGSCQITSIHGRSSLSGLTNIQVFNLSGNPLRRIQSLMSPTLRSLDVSHCQLSYLHHTSLSYLPALIHLNMAHNYRLVLATPTETLLSDSLMHLDISFCNVMQPSLAGFPNLRKAVLTHNLVRVLSYLEFFNNTKLEYLDLSYNSIGTLSANCFRGLTSLKYLDLSWNELPNIPEEALLEMPSLSNINFSRNYLTRVGHLKSLSVKAIDMSQCEIGTVSKDSLEGLQSLVEINLSRNLLTHIPDSISSNTLQYFNLNYNRISSINNFTFFMLPRLTSLSVVGNRFTTIWQRAYFQANPYLENIELNDNMWRCDCADKKMYDFYEYLTLEPSKKEESYNLICNSPNELIGQAWFEACYFTWFPTQKPFAADGVVWFMMVMIIGLSLIFFVVSVIRRSMRRRLAAIQAEREIQVEEARDRLRQLRIRAEQEAQCNAPDPRDLVAPPSYDEALSMPKLNTSSASLNEAGTGKRRLKRGRRKTKSSGDLLEETERNGDVPVVEDFEMNETVGSRRRSRRRRARRYGSHEVAELEESPGARRRRMSEYNAEETDLGDSITVVVEAEQERRPLRPRNRRDSIDDDDPRERDF